MFNHIAPSYDFLNRLLSVGIDQIWRRKVSQIVAKHNPNSLLDIATGTGDLAIVIAKKISNIKIVGVDVAALMLEKASEKIKAKNLNNIIDIQLGDAEDLKFSNSTFDAITVAFGVRNFENIEKGLAEMYRVLRKNGQVCILEFSKPRNKLIRAIYNLYFNNLLPLVGRVFSKNNRAYNYLPESVNAFPKCFEFVEMLEKVGFVNCQVKQYSMGIASLYIAYKL